MFGNSTVKAVVPTEGVSKGYRGRGGTSGLHSVVFIHLNSRRTGPPAVADVATVR